MRKRIRVLKPQASNDGFTVRLEGGVGEVNGNTLHEALGKSVATHAPALGIEIAYYDSPEKFIARE